MKLLIGEIRTIDHQICVKSGVGLQEGILGDAIPLAMIQHVTRRARTSGFCADKVGGKSWHLARFSYVLGALLQVAFVHRARATV
jgi:hypothetical protein